jgi:hypothetical protein
MIQPMSSQSMPNMWSQVRTHVHCPIFSLAIWSIWGMPLPHVDFTQIHISFHVIVSYSNIYWSTMCCFIPTGWPFAASFWLDFSASCHPDTICDMLTHSICIIPPYFGCPFLLVWVYATYAEGVRLCEVCWGLCEFLSILFDSIFTILVYIHSPLTYKARFDCPHHSNFILSFAS